MNRKQTTSLANKISLVLIGVFAVSVVFSFTAKFIQNQWGIYLALVISSVLSYIAFVRSDRGSYLRTISWGMIGSLTLGIILFFFLLNFLSENLSGF